MPKIKTFGRSAGPCRRLIVCTAGLPYRQRSYSSGRLSRLDASNPGIGLIFLILSNARQYRSLFRIWSSSRRPTHLETDVFSSVAFRRAQRAASSLTVMVIF